MQHVPTEQKNTVDIDSDMCSTPVLSVNPLFSEVVSGSNIFIVMEYGNTVPTVFALSDPTGQFEDEPLTLEEALGVLIEFEAITEMCILQGIFLVESVNHDQAYPWQNGECYAKPIMDEEGRVIEVELLGNNNPEFTVHWKHCIGWTVRDVKNDKVLVNLQTTCAEAPHRVGSDGLIIIETDTDMRILYNVHGTLEREYWNYFAGTLIALTFGRTDGFYFVHGQTQIEETHYSNQINQPLTAVDSYLLSVVDSTPGKETSLMIELDGDQITTQRYH